MSEYAMRCTVREWLQRQPDEQLRQAVYALQMIYHPQRLAVLYGMARRART